MSASSQSAPARSFVAAGLEVSTPQSLAIRRDDLSALRNAAPIEAVISTYTRLRKAGNELRGPCPLHEGGEQGISVNTAKGVFYCHDCMQGGHVLDFVMKMECLSRDEAIEWIAARSGITVQEGKHTPIRPEDHTRIIAANRIAAQFYAEHLGSAEAKIAREFLATRGFDQATAQRFSVGYAPAAWDQLVRFLGEKGFTDKELILCGLASESRRGGTIDRFRGRLIWPIRDIKGEVIGFGARKLRDEDHGPKYISTPETPLYKKSQILYGIEHAKREIVRTGRAVVVEGYTDVMACHLAGVTTAIATCGSAFGGGHINILQRLLTDNSFGEVVFIFNGDDTGQKAALRIFEDDQKFAKTISIAITPDGMDPCQLRLAEGDAAVQRLIDDRTPLFAFVLRSIVSHYDLDTGEGRVAAVGAAIPVVAAIRDYALRDHYALKLANMTGMTSPIEQQSTIRRARALARTKENSATSSWAPALDLRSPAHRVERELIKLALQFPKLVSPAFDEYNQSEFTAAPYSAVFRAIASAGGTSAAGDSYLARIREAADDQPTRLLINELAAEPITHKTPEIYAGEVLVRVRLSAVERRATELHTALAHVAPSSNQKEINSLQSELWAVQQYGHRLRSLGVAAL